MRRVEAEKIKEVLVDWGIAEKIIACGFDTTSSNTGVHKGCCVILILHLPSIPAIYRTETEELLLFIDSRLQDADNLPRCDYKEYLELASLILGES